MLTRALALDPGVTTGYCYATIEDNNVLLEPGEERLTPYEFYLMVKKIASGEKFEHGPDELHGHIIYEDFQFRQGVRTGLDLTPAKLIGVIEMVQGKWHLFSNFYVQPPSVQGKKAYWTDAKLKELGVYWPHGRGHARSATKHMLHWIQFGQGAGYVSDPVFKLVQGAE